MATTPTGSFEPDFVVYAERADLEPKPLLPTEPAAVGSETDRVRAADRLASFGEGRDFVVRSEADKTRLEAAIADYEQGRDG